MEKIIDESKYDVDSARKRFRELLKRKDVGRDIRRKICVIDNFYDTASGLFEWTNVKADRGSYSATMRAADTIEKYLNKYEHSKIIKRQKLTKV